MRTMKPIKYQIINSSDLHMHGGFIDCFSCIHINDENLLGKESFLLLSPTKGGFLFRTENFGANTLKWCTL